MKYVAWAMVVLVVLALGGVGYLYSTTHVVIEALGAAAAAAQDQQAYFDELKNGLADGSITGTAFQNTQIGEAKDYIFLTYTVRLRNDTFLAADMIEIQIVPTESDVVQLSDTKAKTLAAHGRTDFTAVLLTKRDSHAIREIIVTYYIWGMPFTLHETYSG